MEQVFISEACLQKLLGPRLRSSYAVSSGGPGAETAVTAVKAVVLTGFAAHVVLSGM